MAGQQVGVLRIAAEAGIEVRVLLRRTAGFVVCDQAFGQHVVAQHGVAGGHVDRRHAAFPILAVPFGKARRQGGEQVGGDQAVARQHVDGVRLGAGGAQVAVVLGQAAGDAAQMVQGAAQHVVRHGDAELPRIGQKVGDVHGRKRRRILRPEPEAKAAACVLAGSQLLQRALEEFVEVVAFQRERAGLQQAKLREGLADDLFGAAVREPVQIGKQAVRQRQRAGRGDQPTAGIGVVQVAAQIDPRAVRTEAGGDGGGERRCRAHRQRRVELHGFVVQAGAERKTLRAGRGAGADAKRRSAFVAFGNRQQRFGVSLHGQAVGRANPQRDRRIRPAAFLVVGHAHGKVEGVVRRHRQRQVRRQHHRPAHRDGAMNACHRGLGDAHRHHPKLAVEVVRDGKPVQPFLRSGLDDAGPVGDRRRLAAAKGIQIGADQPCRQAAAGRRQTAEDVVVRQDQIDHLMRFHLQRLLAQEGVEGFGRLVLRNLRDAFVDGEQNQPRGTVGAVAQR